MIARYLVCLAIFGLLGCSHENVIPVTEAQNKPVFDNSDSSVKPTDESPVKAVGYFTNVKSDGEHQWGYSVKLWRQDDKIYGLIFGTDNLRLIGDPPTGLLENAQFNSMTGKLSFRAKLSLGQSGGGEPVRDVYEFEGVLTKKKLAGNLLVTNELCADKCPEKKKITLPRSEKLSSEMEEYESYKSYAEWKSEAR